MRTTPSGLNTACALTSWNAPPSDTSSKVPSSRASAPLGTTVCAAGSRRTCTSPDRRPSSSDTTLPTNGASSSEAVLLGQEREVDRGPAVDARGEGGAPAGTELRVRLGEATLLVDAGVGRRRLAVDRRGDPGGLVGQVAHLQTVDGKGKPWPSPSSCHPSSESSPVTLPRTPRSSSAPRLCSGKPASFARTAARQTAGPPRAQRIEDLRRGRRPPAVALQREPAGARPPPRSLRSARRRSAPNRRRRRAARAAARRRAPRAGFPSRRPRGAGACR